jgi:hypothetical protein
MTTTAIPDYAKRRNKRDALLELLSDGQRHHMREMERVGGMRFGARVHELKHDYGHDIETIHLGADETAYQLHVKEPVQGALL